MADEKNSAPNPLMIIRLAPIGGLIFIVLALVVLIFANVLADYPLFHPLTL